MIRKNTHLQKVLTITLSFNRIKIAFDLWVYNLITQQKICIHRRQKLYIVDFKNMEYRECFLKSSYTRALTNFHGLWILLSTLACTHEVSTTNIFDY